VVLAKNSRNPEEHMPYGGTAKFCSIDTQTTIRGRPDYYCHRNRHYMDQSETGIGSFRHGNNGCKK
jgi:hypothetical protein